MRLIKNSTAEYETFYESLQTLTRKQQQQSELWLVKPESIKQDGNMLEKYAHFFQNILFFQNQLGLTNGISETLELLYVTLKRQLPLKNVDMFMFDQNVFSLEAVDEKTSGRTRKFINDALRDGLLEWIFESGKVAYIPNLNSLTANGSKVNYLIAPLYEENKAKGLFAILTPTISLSEDSLEIRIIQILTGLAFNKVNYLKSKKEIYSTYQDLQVYQSKLNNDYKLSAIGELTSGIVEDIVSPLQVILSETDLLQEEHPEVDTTLLENIKTQVGKVEGLVNRLVKFSNVDTDKLKLSPCSVNEIMQEYAEIIYSSMKASNYECLVDVEESVPPILSNKNYIGQVLTGIFSILKESFTNSGGIILQSKFLNEKVLIKILSTDHIESFENNKIHNTEDISIKVIQSIMKKHEGSVIFDSNRNSGSSVSLFFPLKRKIRQ